MSFLPLDILFRQVKLHANIDLSQDQLEKLDLYADLLVKKNKVMNLTRITEPADIINLHIVDSLIPIKHINMSQNCKVIDIGTGAGFPGIPLKIVNKDINITLLDSTAKKIAFIKESAELIGIDDITYLTFRAEEIGRIDEHREKYDFVFARAFSNISVTAELCLPLLKQNGKLITYKGENAEEELSKAKPIIGQLGGKPSDLFEYTIADDNKHYILIIQKIKPCPELYPRKYSQIMKTQKRNSDNQN